MTSQRTPVAGAVVGALALVSSAGATMIAYWDFNDGNLAVDRGLGAMTTTISSISFVGGTTTNALPGVSAGLALQLQGTGNNGRSLTISFSTIGMEDAVISLGWKKNSNGFNSNQVAWSTDGVAFNNLSTPLTPPTNTFGLQTLDFGSVAAVDNRPRVFVRLTVNGAASNGGHNQLDNVLVTASAVPAPGTLALTGLGSALALPRRGRAWPMVDVVRRA